MPVNVGDVVIPGETFEEVKDNAADNKKVVLGDGLRFERKIQNLKYILTFFSYFQMQHNTELRGSDGSDCDKERTVV